MTLTVQTTLSSQDLPLVSYLNYCYLILTGWSLMTSLCLDDLDCTNNSIKSGSSPCELLKLLLSDTYRMKFDDYSVSR